MNYGGKTGAMENKTSLNRYCLQCSLQSLRGYLIAVFILCLIKITPHPECDHIECPTNHVRTAIMSAPVLADFGIDTTMQGTAVCDSEDLTPSASIAIRVVNFAKISCDTAVAIRAPHESTTSKATRLTPKCLFTANDQAPTTQKKVTCALGVPSAILWAPPSQPQTRPVLICCSHLFTWASGTLCIIDITGRKDGWKYCIIFTHHLKHFAYTVLLAGSTVKQLGAVNPAHRRRTEFISAPTQEYYQLLVIRHQTTVLSTQYRMSEQTNHTIMESASSMVANTDLSSAIWADTARHKEDSQQSEQTPSLWPKPHPHSLQSTVWRQAQSNTRPREATPVSHHSALSVLYAALSHTIRTKEPKTIEVTISGFEVPNGKLPSSLNTPHTSSVAPGRWVHSMQAGAPSAVAGCSSNMPDIFDEGVNTWTPEENTQPMEHLSSLAALRVISHQPSPNQIGQEQNQLHLRPPPTSPEKHYYKQEDMSE
ncbi:hypothetical protein BDK51DRAFT_25537 [Blyttiomyces helicus]|uniref:Uncharacterized protein n=1 Tax=Blyttiomyces helicus TaxID=388810 RepID=A0A4P9W1W5_9FUNG|nr:hypothetical protein BDK51DRAFT_25537 [Blyttiomyces helicus]|eukprot:RKO86191.1 hypothetical protein BDK51DRAFT_25537 [Blyttiomyces helicus]